MKKMKRIVSLALFLILILGGCGREKQGENLFTYLQTEMAEEAGENKESAAAAQEEADESKHAAGPEESRLVINLVHSAGYGSASDRMARLFKESLEVESKGSIKVEVFPDDTLGYVYDYADALKAGTLDAWIGSGKGALINLLQWAPTLTGAPVDKIEAFMESEEFLTRIKAEFSGAGMEFGTLFTPQYRIMTANIPVESMEDLSRIHMRSFSTGSFENVYWDALGVKTAFYDIHDLYAALQQGLVDAQANTLPLIVRNKLYEQQKYLIQTEHMIYFDGLFFSSDFMESLTHEQRQLIDKAVLEVKARNKDILAAEESVNMGRLDKEHVEILAENSSLIESMRKSGRPAVDQALRASYGSPLVDFVEQALE